jgi:DNA-binding SARP family transcriptional activator
MGSTIPNAAGVHAAGTRTMHVQVPTRLPGLPAPLASHFTGRPDTLGGLGEVLVPGAVVALVADQGAGAAPWEWRGSRGKSQAAVHAAMGLRRAGSVDLVAWVDASGRASLLDGLASAAERAGLDLAGGAEVAAARFAAWLRATRRRWLVVLDDLRDAADVAGLWPGGQAGITLITTRDPAVVAGSRACLVPVGCYSQREAVAALSAWLSTDPEYRSGQLDLALALGCEPTAIAHAGAVISTAELGCREYHGLFLRRRSRVEAAWGGEVPAAAVTWVLSAEHAEILEPGAGAWPLLVMASLLSPHSIPLAVLTSGAACRYLAGSGACGTAAPERAVAAVKALQAAGLLAVDWDGPLPAVRMSAPLQPVVRAVAQEDLLEQAVAAAAAALAERWPGDDPRSDAAALLRSCIAALRSATGDALLAGGRHHSALLAAGRSLDAAGLPGPAAAWWQDLASDSVRLFGEDHQETLAAAGLAACGLLAAGQPEAALAWAQWVMARREATLGPDHPAAIKAATVLGRALAAAGRCGDAIALLAETATRSTRALGPVHATTLAAWHEHAAACLAAGRPADAARSLRQLVTNLTASLGPDAPSTLSAAEQLAAACLVAGRTSEAIDAYGDVLSCRERQLGADHPDALSARAVLASACEAAGDVSAALRHYQQAHAGYRLALGEGHRVTLACAAGLARAYAGSGQLTAATFLLADGISEAGRSLPDGDPLTRELQQARADL